MMFMPQQISDLYRRMMLVIGRGRINIIDDSKNVQMAQIGLNVGEVRDNTPRVSEYGFSSSPPPGTDCVVVFLGGDRSQAAIIGTNSATDRMKGLAPGESALWSQVGQYIYLSENGIVIEAKDLPVTINNATSITVNASQPITLNTPLLQVNGAINATGDIIDNSATQAHNMAAMRTIYNTHTHGGVFSGGSHTDVPDQTE